MYIARFEGDCGKIVQGLVRLEFRESREWSAWTRAVAVILNVLEGVPGANLAHRVVLDNCGAPATTFLVTAPAEAESALRRALGAFTRLDRWIPGSVGLPLAREDFDRRAATCARLRARIRPSIRREPQGWLVGDLRVHDQLTGLFARAAALGHPVAYQGNVFPFEPDAAALRSTKRNVEAIAGVPGMPLAVLQRQREISERLGTAVGICEEIVGCETEEGAQWLTSELRRAFELRYRPLGLHPPEVSFSEEALEDEILAASAPKREAISIEELCATCVDPRDRRALLDWLPDPPEAFHLSPAEPDEDEDTRRIPSGRPISQGPAPGDSFVFASYAHADAARVFPLISRIRDWHFPVWYDEGIPGGAEWDAVIERKIQSARALVLFLSARAADSRYVRREVKYADALAKPVLTVRLEETAGRHGLAMLLGQYQMLDAWSEHAERSIRDALSRWFAMDPAHS